MKKLIWAALLALVANVAEAQRYMVYSLKGNVEDVSSAKSRKLRLRDAVSHATVLNIPMGGCVVLFDEGESRQYTLKTPGRAKVSDMIANRKNSVRELTGDYLSFVKRQISAGGQMLVFNCSDPATVTRDLQVSQTYCKPSGNGDGLMICGTANSFLDDYHAFADSVLNAYHEFTDEVLRDYMAFRDRIFQDFANSVGSSGSWREVGRVEIYIPEEKPLEEEEETVVPFKVDPREPNALTPDLEIQSRPLDFTIAKLPLPQPLPTPKANTLQGRVENVPSSNTQYRSFEFFGTEMKVRWSDECRFRISKLSERGIAEAIKVLADAKYDNLLFDCIMLREEYSLCDWAYYQMLKEMSSTFLGRGTNEAVLLMAMLYAQSGYMMRLARTDEKLLMLVSTQFSLHNYGYLQIDGHNFFLLEGSFNGVYLCDAKFPKEQEMSLIFDSSPKLSDEATEARTFASPYSSSRWLKATVSVNKNLIDFYNNYPSSEFNNDFMTRWAMYANKEMAPDVKEQLYPQMKSWVEGRTQQQAADSILNWIQTAFEYEYDSKVWGYDRAFFAEESLYYPYCDCEDRSILFTRLIRDLLGLKCILVYYPGHLASGVHFTEEVKGDYITVDGDRYTICDPTIIGVGAPVGRTMSSMNNSTAHVIVLE